MKDQVLDQARELAGSLDERQTALLEVLCGAAVSSLKAMLKEGYTAEDCGLDFIAAAALLVLAALDETGENGTIEEFKAGDLTVKKGSRADAASRSLRQQAQHLMGPFLKDRFCFTGV